MSDYEEDAAHYEEDGSIAAGDEDEGERQGGAANKGKDRRRKNDEEDEGEEEEEDEDEEEEDEDEEDEEDEEDPGQVRGKKRRKPQPGVNRFFDLVADVDDGDDDDDDDEDYEKDDFFDEAGHEEDDLGNMNRRAAEHARLDRRQQELTDQDLARIAQDVTRRYRPTTQKYTGDMNEIPQRLLMPSVDDAHLWQVRVRPGKERDLVFNLMRKAISQEFSAKPLHILSVFQRDSLPGMIYIEARGAQAVTQAINGLVGVFPSRGVTLVPIEEMASLLQIKKKDITITPGSWVRVKRGKYVGDLAQVLDIAENGEEVGLKLIPRIDLNPKEDVLTPDGKKRKFKGSGMTSMTRPPQRLFNYEEVIKAHGRRTVAKRNQFYVFANDTFREGYMEKDFKISALVLENVNPTLDEIMRFTRQEDGAENENTVDLSIIAEAAKKEAIQVLQPGDHVEVFEGEQTGVHGFVESIGNEVVTLRTVGAEMEGQKVDIPARSVRKRFKPGDHVKVMTGHNADETGLVVSVADSVVTFLSDMSLQEVSVFSRDLREAAEVGASTNVVGNYELHDLVQLDAQTVGVIFKTERDSFRVLDQNGNVRLVTPQQISMRRDSSRAVATDADGHEIHIKDNMKEIDAESRKGMVLHIHQSFFVFLFNRELAENGGVFIARSRSLISLAPKGTLPKAGTIDLTKINPHVLLATPESTGSFSGKRDNLIGAPVAIVQGTHKGYNGRIRDTNGPIARVELQATNKVVIVDKSKLRRRLDDGSLTSLHAAPRRSNMGPPQGFGRGSATPTSNPYNQSGQASPYSMPPRTPAAISGRTPNPYTSSDSRTPAWNVMRTPNPYADGGKTPAWNAASHTPAWNSGSRTPSRPIQDGGRTPGWSSGSKTPVQPTPAATNSWGTSTGAGTATPAWTSGSSSNNTQWTAETPAVDSAPTPSAWSAATPFQQAPTPAAFTPAADTWPADAADTPAASAPTPVASATFDTGNSVEDEVWWLLKPDLKNNVKGAIADILGTTQAGKRWKDGSYENTRVVIESVNDVGGVAAASTAKVKILPEKTVELTVPAEYLSPLVPGVGDHCLILTGRYTGTKWKILSSFTELAMIESALGVIQIPFTDLATYIP